jgi:hypothetical protein
VFEQIAGLPAHPLLIHAAVVFIPLLAFGSIAYAVVPRLRARIWWAVGLLAPAGAGSAVLARFSGEAFRDRLIRRERTSPQILGALEGHEHFGTMTMWFTLGLAVVTLVALWVLTPRTDAGAATRNGGAAAPQPDIRGTGATATKVVPAPAATTHGRGNPAVSAVLAAATIALSLASLYYCYRTGDSGAHIVWTGS